MILLEIGHRIRNWIFDEVDLCLSLKLFLDLLFGAAGLGVIDLSKFLSAVGDVLPHFWVGVFDILGERNVRQFSLVECVEECLSLDRDQLHLSFIGCLHVSLFDGGIGSHEVRVGVEGVLSCLDSKVPTLFVQIRIELIDVGFN